MFEWYLYSHQCTHLELDYPVFALYSFTILESILLRQRVMYIESGFLRVY